MVAVRSGGMVIAMSMELGSNMEVGTIALLRYGGAQIPETVNIAHMIDWIPPRCGRVRDFTTSGVPNCLLIGDSVLAYPGPDERFSLVAIRASCKCLWDMASATGNFGSCAFAWEPVVDCNYATGI